MTGAGLCWLFPREFYAGSLHSLRRKRNLNFLPTDVTSCKVELALCMRMILHYTDFMALCFLLGGDKIFRSRQISKVTKAVPVP